MKVNIAQCVPASSQYVIRTLQKDIVEAVKKEFIQLIDVKQRQKVCLTPIDGRNRLLKKRPEKWEEIKDGRFMIIKLWPTQPHRLSRASEGRVWGGKVGGAPDMGCIHCVVP